MSDRTGRSLAAVQLHSARRRIRAVIEALEERRLLAHFAVIGDYSSDNSTAPTRDVANLVKSWNPDFVATVGDNNYPEGASSTIDNNIGQWYHQFISPYKGSYGGGATSNQFWPALGNHDYDTNDGTGYSPYLNYFTLPGNERYYTTVQGNVQLFIVNSDTHEPDGTSSTSTQAQWLKSQLAASTAKWKLVLFHHPAYSSGASGDNVYMQWPFQQWGATAVISGHDHDYERLNENGFPYFVDGLGGESIFSFNATEPGSQVRYDSDYGAMLIDTTSTSMTFQFINRSGQVIDTYSIGGTVTLPTAPSGLVAAAQASTQAKLTWTDTSPASTTSFKIERSTDGVNFTQIGTTLAGTTTYLDQGLAPGGSYVYRVRASNSAGDSSYSSTASVKLPTGSTTFLSDLAWVSATAGWGPVEKDMSIGGSNAGDGHTITLNGVTYAKGLGTHAVSDIVYNLNKNYSEFLSDIGVDDETGAGTVDFQVFFDGATTPAYDSGEMTQAGATKSLDLNVSNVTQMTLHVGNYDGDISYDHADWANARLQSAAPSQAPAAPAKLVATAVSPTQINITWNDVLNESGFRVERSIDNVTFAPLGTTGAGVTSYPDTTVSGNTLYYYRVIATNASGDSPPSNVDFARPMQIPSDPSNLVATAVSTTQINLSWKNNNLEEELDWDIERSTNGTTWTPLTTVPETEVYSDTSNLQPNTTYYYHVRAGNLAGKSGWSNVASATTSAAATVPTAPSNLVATAASSTQINLTWQDNSGNETGFKIERSLDGLTNWTSVTTTAANAVSYSDSSGLASGTKYYYRVRATNAVGDSGNTAVANATTFASTSATYIAAGSTWKYLDNGTNQGTAWRATAFVDTSWKSGAAQLGYGDGDEATVVSYGSNANNKYITTYFRKSFTVADASLVSALNLQLIRDDGAVVYLNGTEVYRNNMPTGTIAYNTLASTAIGGADESTWYSATINPALLVSGTNEIAVEMHQSDVTSSDISFDFQLTATLAQSPTPPTAPSNLVATAAGVSQINLTWTDNSSNETGFEIDRSTDNVTFTALPTGAAANATSFSDTGLQSGKQYWYQIRAINGVGNSAFTAIATATTAVPTPPAAPSGLAASAASSSQINLTWTDNATNETGFIVERSTDGVTNWTQIATPAANATSYSDSNALLPFTTYYYRVRAVNGVGPSANTAVANAKTLQSNQLPSPFVDADIGTTGAAGSASYSGGVYTVKGAGSDVWNSADSLNFVYQQMTGNCTIIAHVASMQNTNGWAKAGVMIRNTLDAGSAEASVFMTPSNGVAVIDRTKAGSSSSLTSSSGTAPYWIKLVRSGSTFTAYKSANGTSWTKVTSFSITMNSTVYVGLAVCAKAPGTLNTATFDNVSITSP